MHRIVSQRRFLPLAIPAALVAALLAVMFLSGGSGARHTLATGTCGFPPTAPPTSTPCPTPGLTPELTGITCSDVYLDLDPQNALGDPPGTEDKPTAAALTRIESAGTANVWKLTTVSYLGPDIAPGDEGSPIADLIPDKGPTADSCAQASANAASGAEAEQMNSHVDFANEFGIRPGSTGYYGEYDATNAEGAGTCGDGLDNDSNGLTDMADPACYDAGTQLTSMACGFSEAQGAWVRIDSIVVITKLQGVNYGRTTLYLGTSVPTSLVPENPRVTTDPGSCLTGGAIPFASVTVNRSRTPTTDHPNWGNNAALITAGLLSVDADGPNKETPTNGAQTIDGMDSKADDWDGDGCPDWDELDHNYTAYPAGTPTPPGPVITGPVNGLDPFNPNDCDQNFSSNISLSTTLIHNTANCGAGDIATGVCVGNGQYFRCLGDVTDAKVAPTPTPPAGTRPLTFRLGCYSDSTGAVVNPAYDRAYDPSLTEDPAGVPTPGPGTPGPTPDGSCGDGINNAPTRTPPPATPDMVKDSGDSDCHAGSCPGALPDMCGDGKADVPPPGCRLAPTSVPTATAVPPCANSLPHPATPAASHCPALLNGSGSTATVKINCAPQRWNYIGITPAEYPVVASGTYNPTTNQITIGGCFAGLGGAAFGPNVYGVGLIDAHLGVGTFTIYFGIQSSAECSVGPPFSTGASFAGTVSIVELQSKKYLRGASAATPIPCLPGPGICPLYDSDKDGCPDSQELLGPAQMVNAQRQGGLRDPYNKWDFFDPYKLDNARKHNSSDITAVVRAFGKDEWKKDPANPGVNPPILNALYDPAFDRTVIGGSNSWDLGPPNGYVKSDDITNAVKSFDGNCPHL